LYEYCGLHALPPATTHDLPPQVPFLSGSGPADPAWLNGTSVEVINCITQFLFREDVQSMRLTCKTLNKLVSPAYFSRMILPFAPISHGNKTYFPATAFTNRQHNIGGVDAASGGIAMAQGTTVPRSGVSQTHQLTKLPEIPATNSLTAATILRDWGGAVKRFALTFDVDEGGSFATLSNLPLTAQSLGIPIVRTNS
jgi:hypothetical protein